MLRLTFVPAITFVVLSLLASGDAAAVGVQRTFVASTGNDTNPCSIALPCRGFAAALAQTASGGEIIVLDSAGYGPVTITQAVSIIAPQGIYAGVSVASGDGITISAPGAQVVLRGLSINGLGGSRGIYFDQGSKLRIERCNISNMINEGLRVVATGSVVSVTDSIITGSGKGMEVLASAMLTLEGVLIEGSTALGVRATSVPSTVVRNTRVTGTKSGSGMAFTMSAAGTYTAAVEGSTALENADHGIVFAANVPGAVLQGSVVGSNVVRNDTASNDSGIRAFAFGGGVVDVTVTNTLVEGNHYGIDAWNPGATVTVSRSNVVGNVLQGFANTGQSGPIGTFYTLGNNVLRGNNGQDLASQTVGTITSIGLQ